MATYFWETDEYPRKSILSKLQLLEREEEKSLFGLMISEDSIIKEMESISDNAYDDMHQNSPHKTQDEYEKEYIKLGNKLLDVRKEIEKMIEIMYFSF